MTVPQAFTLAIQHHQAGQLAQAEALYRQILSVQPNHADSRHNLGLIAHAAGRHDLAVEWIGQAITLEPNNASSYFNLGGVYRALRQPHEAITAYRRALQLQPSYLKALINLANVFQEQGQLDEAVATNRRALEFDPDSPEAHNNLANALLEQGQTGEAVALLRRIIALKPDHAEAHFNLGITLIKLNQVDEAIVAFRRMLQLRPDTPDAWNNLGGLLAEQNRLDEAEAAYRQAIQLKPDYAEAFSNLGKSLAAHRQLDEAVAAYRQALQLKPDLPETCVDLGNALKDQGRLDEALAAYRQGLQLDPNLAKAHSNVVYALLFHSDQERRSILEEQNRWNRQFSAPVQRLVRPHTNDRNLTRRLRIGYVSGDFRNHVVGWNLMPLFERHDSTEFEIFCYSEVRRMDSVTETFRERADHWRDIRGVADEAVAEMIRQDGVDILVDLAQHLAGNRLTVFARQPAPVQVSFAGYPAGTGLDTIGYRISDRYLESEIEIRSSEFGGDLPTPISDLRAAERVFLLDSFWCYDPCDVKVEINELPANENGHITFGSLNAFCKSNEPTLKLWAQVLKKVARSRLLLLSPEGSHVLRAREILQREGIEPHRVEFVDLRPRPAYLALYHRVDIVLDSFLYNGHTTGLDALWMGVPVVSLVGEHPVSRAGLSQLSNLGLEQLAVFSEDDYVRAAVQLAGDWPRLADLRQSLRSRMQASPLRDAPRFARGIETAYRVMWRHWCQLPQ